MRSEVLSMLQAFPDVLQMHGFYADSEKKLLRFDVIVSFDAKDRLHVYEEICQKVQARFPDYQVNIVLDADFSEVDNEE